MDKKRFCHLHAAMMWAHECPCPPPNEGHQLDALSTPPWGAWALAFMRALPGARVAPGKTVHPLGSNIESVEEVEEQTAVILIRTLGPTN